MGSVMPELLKDAIATWVEANLQEVSGVYPISNHIDEILGRSVQEPEAIELSINAYEFLVEMLRSLGVPVQPRLVIPLTWDTNELQRTVPQTLEEIRDQWRKCEPPSLFLLAWDRSRYLTIYEEYERPLPFNPTPVTDTYAFYTEFRDITSMRQNWEFVRSVCIDYYPPDHQVHWSRLTDLYVPTDDASLAGSS